LLPWLWLLLLDLAHLRQFPEQVVLCFSLQSLPGFLLPLFLLAQLPLHLLPLEASAEPGSIAFLVGDFRLEAGFFIPIAWVLPLGLRGLAKG